MSNTEQSSAKKISSLLFVCAGNTCRSVIAETLARRRFGDFVHVSSAGLKPQKPEDAKNAIDMLKIEFDLDASGHIPRGAKTLNLEAFDLIVAMDKDVAKQLKTVTKREVIVWQIDDPGGNDLFEYRQCALKIMQQIARLSLPPSGKPSTSA